MRHKSNVSRQTYGRILAEARAIVADALVMGKRVFRIISYKTHEAFQPQQKALRVLWGGS